MEITDQHLEHLTPLGWEHISLTGDYVWNPNLTTNLTNLRDLRDNTLTFVALFACDPLNSEAQLLTPFRACSLRAPATFDLWKTGSNRHLVSDIFQVQYPTLIRQFRIRVQSILRSMDRNRVP